MSREDRRIFAVVAWAIVFVQVAANVEVWIQRKRAGLPFRFLP
jgi:hypothetical protein